MQPTRDDSASPAGRCWWARTLLASARWWVLECRLENRGLFVSDPVAGERVSWELIAPELGGSDREFCVRSIFSELRASLFWKFGWFGSDQTDGLWTSRFDGLCGLRSCDDRLFHGRFLCGLSGSDRCELRGKSKSRADICSERSMTLFMWISGLLLSSAVASAETTFALQGLKDPDQLSFLTPGQDAAVLIVVDQKCDVPCVLQAEQARQAWSAEVPASKMLVAGVVSDGGWGLAKNRLEQSGVKDLSGWSFDPGQRLLKQVGPGAPSQVWFFSEKGTVPRRKETREPVDPQFIGR